jgi:hypothetical protein
MRTRCPPLTPRTTRGGSRSTMTDDDDDRRIQRQRAYRLVVHAPAPLVGAPTPAMAEPLSGVGPRPRPVQSSSLGPFFASEGQGGAGRQAVLPTTTLPPSSHAPSPKFHVCWRAPRSLRCHLHSWWSLACESYFVVEVRRSIATIRRSSSSSFHNCTSRSSFTSCLFHLIVLARRACRPSSQSAGSLGPCLITRCQRRGVLWRMDTEHQVEGILHVAYVGHDDVTPRKETQT